jgi:hypothetical protein
MIEIKKLIDEASAIAGTRYKVAQALHVAPSLIYSWESGRKPCPPADIALMAHIAGMDPQKWLIRATLERYEGTPKGEQLAQALGKPLQATGGGNAGHGQRNVRGHSGRPERRFPQCIFWKRRQTLCQRQDPHTSRFTRLFFCPAVCPQHKARSSRKGGI